MFSNSDEFYKDRILWKASQHKLKLEYFYSALDLDLINFLESKFALDGEPILVFWESQNRWTVVTTRKILSVDGASLNIIALDDINKKIKIVESTLNQATKENAEFLLLGEESVKIWAPSGGTLFALFGILKMFPLKFDSNDSV
ncbi:hypothetical protein [Undibacterium sp. TJN19]|uniref:hypothetical protein n=1 Tax=Undibacterium sp. TJN19 TaxID=3413055 RepID=UPI003BF1F212